MLSAAPSWSAFFSSALTIALTPRIWVWVENVGTSSFRKPVRMFTTPPGKSETASISPSTMAGYGYASDARHTTVFPERITGAI